MNMHASLAEAAIPFAIPVNRWDDNVASTMSEAELLVYRSNLLGADLTVTNFGGGNTSAKVMESDPLTGAETQVLWVKGSGGDIGSMGSCWRSRRIIREKRTMTRWSASFRIALSI